VTTPVTTPPTTARPELINQSNEKNQKEEIEEPSLLPEFTSKEFRQKLNAKYENSRPARIGAHGNVQLKLTIDKEGNVKSSEITSPSAYPSLNKYAQETVSTWKYKPGKRNGKVEEREVPVSLTYELKQ